MHYYKCEINVVYSRWMTCFRCPSVIYSPVTPPGISIISLPVYIDLYVRTCVSYSTD